jgi:hypothetical protein
MGDKLKKAARELQRIGQGAVSYSVCRRLLLASGFDEAKRQIEQWVRDGNAEVERLGAERSSK